MSSAAQSQSQYVPHYTIADYRQWAGDWELWSGIPVAMTPSPFGPHQAVAARLARLLGNELEAARCDCHVLHEIDWVVSDDMVPETHLHTAPALIAEVLSASTEQKDRVAKRALYERQGVAYYLILDPSRKTVEVHLRTADGSYRLLDAARPQEIRLGAKCVFTLDPCKLFPGSP